MRTAAQRGWTLHDYQLVARDFLAGGVGGRGLFLDMGLGKTASSLSALTPEHLPVLVVAPKRVAETVWPVEVQLWRPDLRVRVASGNATATQTAAQVRAAAIADTTVDIVVIGQDNLADVLKVRRGRGNGFKTFIIDELSGYKSRKSTRHRAARTLIKRAATQHVWGLTGTPSPNSLLDLWPQLHLLDGGKRLGPTIGGFREQHFTIGRRGPQGVVTRWDLRPGHAPLIHAKIEDICLSMETEGRIKLPPVTHNEVVVELPPIARRAYRDLKEELLADITDVLGGEVHTADTAAVLSMRLSQLTAGFIYVDDADLRDYAATRVHDVKVKAVREIVDATDSPVLVFYRFKEELKMLKAEFKKARTIDEPGCIGDWNEGKVPVLLAHPLSAGHGLNLQHGGHTIVWASLPWSLEQWQQANARLPRQGQKHPVVIHSIVCRRTVDQLQQQRLRTKELGQRALLDHLESPV